MLGAASPSGRVECLGGWLGDKMLNSSPTLTLSEAQRLENSGSWCFFSLRISLTNQQWFLWEFRGTLHFSSVSVRLTALALLHQVSRLLLHLSSFSFGVFLLPSTCSVLPASSILYISCIQLLYLHRTCTTLRVWSGSGALCSWLPSIAPRPR